MRSPNNIGSISLTNDDLTVRQVSEFYCESSRPLGFPLYYEFKTSFGGYSAFGTHAIGFTFGDSFASFDHTFTIRTGYTIYLYSQFGVRYDRNPRKYYWVYQYSGTNKSLLKNESDNSTITNAIGGTIDSAIYIEDGIFHLYSGNKVLLSINTGVDFKGKDVYAFMTYTYPYDSTTTFKFTDRDNEFVFKDVYKSLLKREKTFINNDEAYGYKL